MATANVGMICYACHSGLGHLARAFYMHGITHRAMINSHPRYPQHREWYKGVSYDRAKVPSFLKGLDALILFENAFQSWNVVHQAKNQGIKIVLIPMYEWTPNPLPVNPDLVICPSDLDIEYFKDHHWVRLNIPYDTGLYPRKVRICADIFVHNAGHGQVGFAKGTPEVLEAMTLVKSPVKLICRGQISEPRIKQLFDSYRASKNVIFIEGDVPDSDLYSSGDVFVNAERYNGLSLPLQEAYGSGMMVMTTNRFPANTWLPNDPLIPPKGYDRHRVNHTIFDRAEIDPQDIADTIDAWYGRDIGTYSLSGIDWGDANSWEKLGPQYKTLIQNLVEGKLSDDL